MIERREKRSATTRVAEWLFPGIRRTKRKQRMKTMMVSLLITIAVAVIALVAVHHFKKYRQFSEPEQSAPAAHE